MPEVSYPSDIVREARGEPPNPEQVKIPRHPSKMFQIVTNMAESQLPKKQRMSEARIPTL
jgi:3-deoxy-D-manno-octulosonic-acid transferase